MKNVNILLSLIVAAVLIFGCAPQATKEECDAACKKNASFEKFKPDEQTTKAINDAQKKLAEVMQNKKAKAAEIEKNYVEKQKAVDAVAKPEKKAEAQKALNEEKAKEMAPIEQEFAPLLQTSKDEVKTLMSAIAAARKAFTEAKKKATADCNELCVKETKKPQADCQAKAADAAAWAACK